MDSKEKALKTQMDSKEKALKRQMDENEAVLRREIDEKERALKSRLDKEERFKYVWIAFTMFMFIIMIIMCLSCERWKHKWIVTNKPCRHNSLMCTEKSLGF